MKCIGCLDSCDEIAQVLNMTKNAFGGGKVQRCLAPSLERHFTNNNTFLKFLTVQRF